jgi:hypothetical protein
VKGFQVEVMVPWLCGAEELGEIVCGHLLLVRLVYHHPTVGDESGYVVLLAPLGSIDTEELGISVGVA